MDPGPSSTLALDRDLPAWSRPQRPATPDEQRPLDDSSRPLRGTLQPKLRAPSGSLWWKQTSKKTPMPTTVMKCVNESAAPGLAGTAAEVRQLNVSDPLGCLDVVKLQLQDKPEVYNRFLDIMNDFKSQV
ncbi:hypothetical protein L227DRAFT_617686 [Lentinus tigrinus ALCF2SS1-6]|uniref:Uncharacterized protein n=1 Tax=Lentinus tigrinus ALCF2SS1-6 TaxID=1328759 RepID=A0A5C2RLV6_9APHY|nr:hypothetical protein L227DRAFT_617686 [Lentinus tigrinus ALCF2SS1-6]